MTSTTLHIFLSMPDKSVFLSPLHELKTIQVVSNCVFCQSLNKYPVKFRFMKVQWFRFRKILKKVVNFFIEDLQKRAINVIALVLSSLVVLYLFE